MHLKRLKLSKNQNTIFAVAAFNKVLKALTFNSELADLKGYVITHIVIERMYTNNRYEMVWECLSEIQVCVPYKVSNSDF